MSRYREHPVFAGFNVVGSFDELVEQQQHLLQLSADGTRLERVLVDEDDEEVEVLFLPANVTEVNAEAFYQENLRAILVHPDSRSFRSVAGALCNYELTEVIRVPALSDFHYRWPATVTRIHSHAFCNNQRYDIGIPPQVTHISEYAFAWNDMEEFDIPENVVEIAETAFLSCDNLSQFTVDPSNPCYSAVDGILYDKHQQRIISFPQAYEEEDDDAQ